MKPLLIAALLFASPAIAAEMTLDEALNIYRSEQDWPVCEQGNAYDGGPRLSEAEIAEACAKYEEAKNRLAELGIQE